HRSVRRLVGRRARRWRIRALPAIDAQPGARLHRRVYGAGAACRARDGGIGRNGVRRRTWLILIGVVLLVATGIGARIYRSRNNLPAVTVEAIRARDLDAIVSASGKIQPKRQVNVSATTMGRVTRLAVQEGQRVK